MSRRSSRSSRPAASVMSSPVERRSSPRSGSSSRMTTRAERRLAAAGLTDQPERLARVDLEIDAVDRVHVADLLLDEDAARDREVLLRSPSSLTSGVRSVRACRRSPWRRLATSCARASLLGADRAPSRASGRWHADAWSRPTAAAAGPRSCRPSKHVRTPGWNATPGRDVDQRRRRPLMGCEALARSRRVAGSSRAAPTCTDAAAS